MRGPSTSTSFQVLSVQQQLDIFKAEREATHETTVKMLRESLGEEREAYQQKINRLDNGLTSVNGRVDKLEDGLAEKVDEIQKVKDDVDFLMTAEKGRQSLSE